jgi:hypothetical protein
MFSETTFLLVFGLGAVCMLLGFFLVLRGVGSSDSESSIKLIGIEVRASRVGPGVLFALFGVVLIVTALSKQPGGPTLQAEAPKEQPKPPAPTPEPDTPANPPQPSGGNAASGAVTGAIDDAVDTEPVSTGGGPPAAARQAREAQLIGQFLAEASQGGCNPQLLGPVPLGSCQRAMPMMQAQLQQAGPVVNIQFMASVQTPYGVADRFVVTHSVGTTAIWSGILGNDGRFLVLGSP